MGEPNLVTTESQLRAIVNDCVRKAVGDIMDRKLTGLGFDLTDPIEVQQDVANMRRMREAVETVQRRSVRAAIALVLSAIGGLLLLGLQAMLGRHT